LVRRFIYTRFGVEYCRERVRQLLHTLSFADGGCATVT
jgi:hypothetical protein